MWIIYADDEIHLLHIINLGPTEIFIWWWQKISHKLRSDIYCHENVFNHRNGIWNFNLHACWNRWKNCKTRHIFSVFSHLVMYTECFQLWSSESMTININTCNVSDCHLSCTFSRRKIHGIVTSTYCIKGNGMRNVCVHERHRSLFDTVIYKYITLRGVDNAKHG